jgi:hypothetical protein
LWFTTYCQFYIMLGSQKLLVVAMKIFQTHISFSSRKMSFKALLTLLLCWHWNLVTELQSKPTTNTMERVLFEKQIFPQPMKYISKSCGRQKFTILLICSNFRAFIRSIIYKYTTIGTSLSIMDCQHTFLKNTFLLLLWPFSGWNY